MSGFEEYVRILGLKVTSRTEITTGSDDATLIWYRDETLISADYHLWCSCEEIACDHIGAARQLALKELAAELRSVQNLAGDAELDPVSALSTVADWYEAGRFLGQYCHVLPSFNDFLELLGLPRTTDGINRLVMALDDFSQSGRMIVFDFKSETGTWIIQDLIRFP